MEELLKTVIIFIIIDILSGFYKAFNEKSLNSKKMYQGIIKKSGYFLILIIVFQLDLLIGEHTFIPITCYYIIGTEGLSIFENIGKYLKLPKTVKKYFSQLMEGDEDEDEENKENNK